MILSRSAWKLCAFSLSCHTREWEREILCLFLGEVALQFWPVIATVQHVVTSTASFRVVRQGCDVAFVSFGHSMSRTHGSVSLPCGGSCFAFSCAEL